MSVGVLPRELGRYVLYDQIAAGGMATVHFGRMHGAIGFSRLVAVKRLHPNYANDAHFVQMFLDEARLAARVAHPNVVSTLDVVADETEVFLVMEHVLGDSLEAMMPREGSRPIPLPVISSIVCGVLEGLHGAHEALGDTGEPLEIVHRDVSPHNILVGVDGVARVFDFGIAKAAINTQETREGVIKGKVTYMAPEQVRGTADRRADLYAAGVILWELLTGRRRHAGERNDGLFLKLAKNEIEAPPPPSTLRGDATPALDAVVARATHPDPAERFDTAREMAVALEAAVAPAPARDVTDWVREVAGTRIERVASVMRRIESDIQGAPDGRLTTMARAGSTGSIHVVTATIPRTGTGSLELRADGEPRASERPTMHAAPRSWTMPAALVAFTVAMLLVGLRTLTRRDAASAAPIDAAPITSVSTTNGVAPRASEPSTELAPSPRAAELEGAPDGLEATADMVRAAAAGARVRSRAALAFARSPGRRRAPAPAPTARAEATSTSSPAHKPGCESPFAIGPDGIRQIKPECL
ncbi:MAG: serine/threonine protein kinase [Labilithrix sp.]|nr:serine/threonine protein kinase [Labilithrix sp.]